MKNVKHHIISIFLIALMIIFSLATSYSTFTEVEIKNNSSQDLNITVFYYERRLPDNEANVKKEFDVPIGENIKIETSRSNSLDRPVDFIRKIIIRNVNTGLEKEYVDNDFYDIDTHEDKLFVLIKSGKLGFHRSKEGKTTYYIWEITDTSLE